MTKSEITNFIKEHNVVPASVLEQWQDEFSGARIVEAEAPEGKKPRFKLECSNGKNHFALAAVVLYAASQKGKYNESQPDKSDLTKLSFDRKKSGQSTVLHCN